MEITVRYFTTLREVTGKQEEKIELAEGSILEDALRLIARKYGEKFERYVSSGRAGRGLPLLFLIDGENAADLGGFKSGLREGCTLTIIPPVAGG
jgi:MoaD family protein